MVDLIKSIKSATAIDDHTVEIKTEGPNPILLNQLTQIFVMSEAWSKACLLYTSPSPRDRSLSRMPSSA